MYLLSKFLMQKMTIVDFTNLILVGQAPPMETASNVLKKIKTLVDEIEGNAGE